MNECLVAKRIIQERGDWITDRNGDPTLLYWHMKYCEECNKETDHIISQVNMYTKGE